MNPLMGTNNFELLAGESLSLEELQERMDLAEKERRNPFADLNDVEVLLWYIHEQKHADQQNDRAERTKKEYANELRLFIENLMQSGAAIGIDIVSL